MADWGPVLIGVLLFILLTPGLLFQLPGSSRTVEFSNFRTSGISIVVHSFIFFGLYAIFLIAIGVHIYFG
uniref:Transmembrane protein n=1 Tax=Picea sitchensis TaxID=3332 RepID=A9NYK3_PICSI|nr:unknown [Picea sitchensis]